MKLFKMLAVSVAIFAMAACGGGDSTTTDGGGSTTTPGVTSAKTTNAMSNATVWMYENTMNFRTLLAGGATASVKETYTDEADRVSCTVEPAGTFECRIWDAEGSLTSSDNVCVVKGSFDAISYFMTSATYDCYNYNPEAGVLVDGKWVAEFIVNEAAMSTASVSKSVNKEDTSAGCEVEDVEDVCGQTVDTGGASCTVLCGELTCTSAEAVVVISWTVDATRGLTMTDECGTYEFSPGFVSATNICLDAASASSMTMSMSFDINGSINGEAFEQDMSVDCTINY